MKIKLYAAGLLLAASLSAQAGIIYTFNGPFADNGAGAGVIPDNSTIGLGDSHALSGLNFSISSVMLSVTLQGGAATDLSGYLRLGDLSGSPVYDLTAAVQGQNLSGGSPVTFSVDVTSSFNTLNPNNDWTLFFADGVNGDHTTLNSWNLDITAVPEPVNVALGIFGGLMGLVILARSGRVKRFFWKKC